MEGIVQKFVLVLMKELVHISMVNVNVQQDGSEPIALSELVLITSGTQLTRAKIIVLVLKKTVLACK